MEESLLVFFERVPYVISFFAGILTFLSPCVLPLIPAYLSYISEISLEVLKESGMLGIKERFKILRRALFFVFGLGLVFIIFGAVAARILKGGILLSPILRYVAGGVLVLFGLHTIGVFRIPMLYYQKTLRFKNPSFKGEILKDYFVPFLLGVSFSLGWTPCVGPILASIISLASFEKSSGITLLSVYTLGLAISFLFCALLIGYAFSFLEFVKRYFRVIEWVAGCLLIGIGILVASGGMSTLSMYLVEHIG